MPGWQTVDGKRLRQLRRERMLSQQELAKKAGAGQATLSLLERGERTAQPRTVRRLADALGVEPRELVAED
jgi:transcriptional regulator with XRE-family HTH domain